MDTEADLTGALRETVSTHFEDGRPLDIRGGGTHRFYGRAAVGSPLEIAGHRGIIDYEPTELVITARAGTRISELESALTEHRQQLPFEPPRFGPEGTLGGAVATGLSGPRRPYAGALRDFVLGVKLINGRGQVLSFGGQVMKNVAGYDAFRLQAGALGTLGVLLEVSLKVLPEPAEQRTLAFELDERQAILQANRWAGSSLPLSAAAWEAGLLRVRLAGSRTAVEAAAETLGGEPADGDYWPMLRDHRLPFLSADVPLWRLSVPPAAPCTALPGDRLVDWGGAQRWVRTDADMTAVRAAAAGAGGHATLFRGGDRQGQVFHPLGDGAMALHQRLKTAFDPHGILNPGRLDHTL